MPANGSNSFDRKSELGKRLLEKMIFVLHEHLKDLIQALHSALWKRDLRRSQGLVPRNEGGQG